LSNFTDKDKGWKKFMAQAQVNSGETAGFVGYLRSSGAYKPKNKPDKKPNPTGDAKKASVGITIAQIASIHEFGSKDGTIPERSFMRSALADHSKEFKRLTKKVCDQVLMGRTDKKKGVGILCQKVVDWFAAKIDENVPPPNTQATIDRKGSDHTLIDTGQLKNSLDWEIRAGKK
jgi:hypothetical protein